MADVAGTTESIVELVADATMEVYTTKPISEIVVDATREACTSQPILEPIVDAIAEASTSQPTSKSLSSASKLIAIDEGVHFRTIRDTELQEPHALNML